MNSVGPAVQDACLALKEKLRMVTATRDLAFITVKKKEITLANVYLTLAGSDSQQYSLYSFSVHFAEVRVHESPGDLLKKSDWEGYS